MRVWLLALSLSLTVLAGCSDPPKIDLCADDPASCGPAVDPDDLDEGKGVIRGLVIDTAIVPIADASVSLIGQDASETTDASGGFLFLNLEPGTYFLEVRKLGFETVQASAAVTTEVQPPVLKIQLTPNPSELPFVVTDSYEAFISCGFKTLNFVWDAGWCDPTGAAGIEARDDAIHTFTTGTEQSPEHYQTEIIWEAAQPLSDGLVTIQCATDNSGCDSGVGSDRLCNVRGSSPLVCAISNDIPSEDVPGGGNNFTTLSDGAGFTGIFTIGLFSNCAVQCDPVTGVWGVGLAIDQSVFMYTNVFYNFRPPVDWMFLNDGLAAPPS